MQASQEVRDTTTAPGSNTGDLTGHLTAINLKIRLLGVLFGQLNILASITQAVTLSTAKSWSKIQRS